LLSDIKMNEVSSYSFERLSKLRGSKELIGAKIGVAGGEHALSILETLDIKRLFLIDPCAIYEGYEEGKTNYGVNQKPLSDTEVLAQDKLKRHSNKIAWINILATEAVNNIEESLDIVYLDGKQLRQPDLRGVKGLPPTRDMPVTDHVNHYGYFIGKYPEIKIIK